TNVVGGQRWRIIAREARHGAGDCADWISICGRIDHHNVVCLLHRVQKDKSSRAAVETFDIGGQCTLFEGTDHVNADTLIAHEDVAEPEYQHLRPATCHDSPARTSIRRRWKRWFRALRCSHDKRRDT